MNSLIHQEEGLRRLGAWQGGSRRDMFEAEETEYRQAQKPESILSHGAGYGVCRNIRRGNTSPKFTPKHKILV